MPERVRGRSIADRRGVVADGLHVALEVDVRGWVHQVVVPLGEARFRLADDTEVELEEEWVQEFVKMTRDLDWGVNHVVYRRDQRRTWRE